MSNIENTSKQESTADKWTARIVGVLIIAGYLVFTVPESASESLTYVAAHSTQLTVGVLIMVLNPIAVVGIAVLLFPVLKRYNETIAIGYLATRLFESVVLIVGLLGLLLLVPLSQEYVQASAANASTFEILRTLAIQVNSLALPIAMIGLSIGSLPFCYLLYQSQLVPRVISVLGLIGYPALLILMVITLLGVGFGPMQNVLFVPGMLFEFGFALWLIFKGFGSSTTESASANRRSQVEDPITHPQQPRED